MPKSFQSGKLRIRKNCKRPYYYVRTTVVRIDKVSGERVKARPEHKLGFVDEIDRKEAMKRRQELLETVNSGRFVIQSQIRFKALAERFLSARAPNLGIATQSKYRTQILNHILPAFGEQKLCDIDRPAVEGFLTAKKETLGWWSRVDLKGVLSAIFTAAKDWKLWDGENPTHGVRIGKKRYVREKRLLTSDQMRTFLAALPDHLRFLVLILFGLGLRVSEALGLKWKDVDFDAGKVKIRRRWYRGDLSEEGENKSEASTADLPMSTSLAYEFQRRYPGPHKRDAFIFLGEDGLMPPDDRDLLRFGWHAFRHQNITWRQTVGGATPLEAQKGARHASLDMTLLYTMTDHERETAQQQRMFDELLGMPGTETKQ